MLYDTKKDSYTIPTISFNEKRQKATNTYVEKIKKPL